MTAGPPGILLGYEVGSGEPVSVPLGHTVVTGQSQRAGKTTALEAMVARSGARALAFITKRGEGSFEDAHRLQPYFRERADWQFVASLLESTMREKMRFERAWILRAARGAQTLADVRQNVTKLQEKAGAGLNHDVYMMLGAYLDLVVPLIARTQFAREVRVRPGVNVVDVSAFPLELQMLVIQSTIDWVNDREEGVVVIIPEAWEMVPESRGSPVKVAVQALVRKGAALGNFAWLDSQDLAGVSKDAVRQARVWLLGVQREVNEVKRTIAHIPAGVKRPRADDVANLQRGQFWACWDSRVVKVYVQPAWMSAEDAILVATGKGTPGGAHLAYRGRLVQEIAPPEFRRPEELSMGHAFGVHHEQQPPIADRQHETEEDDVGKEDLDRLEGKLDKIVDLLGPRVLEGGPVVRQAEAGTPVQLDGPALDMDTLYAEVRRRLLAEKATLVRVLTKEVTLSVFVEQEVVEVDGKTLRGRLAMMIADGFFDTPKKAYAAFVELERVAFRTSKPNVYTECGNLASMGFLTKEGDGYLVAPGAKSRVKRK